MTASIPPFVPGDRVTMLLSGGKITADRGTVVRIDGAGIVVQWDSNNEWTREDLSDGPTYTIVAAPPEPNPRS